jgi:hypothetical protein
MQTLPFVQRFFVGYYATQNGEAGFVAVDKASDYPDGVARAEWYARRDPQNNYTVFLVVDVHAAKLMDAYLAGLESAFDAARKESSS